MTDNWIEEPYSPQSRYDDMSNVEPEFWKKKKLEDMTKQERELLCDGCGKCCLNKVQIRKEIKFTNTVCRFLDCQTCLCKIYQHRFEKVPDCRDIDIAAIREQPRWLPITCAYWRLDNGLDLPEWHPLLTGQAESVYKAQMSLRNRNVISESEVLDYEDYLIDWKDI